MRTESNVVDSSGDPYVRQYEVRGITWDQAYGTAAAGNASGTPINESSALNYVAVFSAVRLLSSTLATLPFQLFRRNGDNKERDREHGVAQLLATAPNEEMTPVVFQETLWAHVLTWGNGYAEIVRDGAGRPIALWPLRPDYMEVKRVGGRLVYIYRPPGYTPTRLSAADVLHRKGLGFDGTVGYSPIRMARRALDTAIAIENHGAAFFGNNARPGLILKAAGDVQEPEQKRLVADFERIHRGTNNAHRTALLTGGMELDQIGIPNDDAQFLQSRRFSTEEVARIYNMPLHLLQDLSGATLNNIEEMSILFVRYTLTPYLVRDEQEIELKLLLPAERRTHFAKYNVNAVVRGDMQSRAQFYQVLSQIGAISPNEVRDKEDMNPIEGLNEPFVQMQNVPATQQAAGGDSGERSLPEQATAPQIEARMLATRKSITKSTQAAVEQAAKRIGAVENKMILRNLEKVPAGGDLGKFFEWLNTYLELHRKFVAQEFAAAFKPSAALIAVDVIQEVNGEEKRRRRLTEEEIVRREIVNQLEIEAIRYSNYLAKQYNRMTENQLRKLAREFTGLEQIPALRKRIEEWEEKRPAKVARRQAHEARQQMQRKAYGELGVERIRWVTIGENCPLCDEMNGRVVSLGTPFLEYDRSDPQKRIKENFTDDNQLKTGWRLKSKDYHGPPLHNGCDCETVAD